MFGDSFIGAVLDYCLFVGWVVLLLGSLLVIFENLRTIYIVKVLKRGDFSDYGIFGQLIDNSDKADYYDDGK